MTKVINASRPGLLLPHVVKRRVKISPFYRFFTYRSFGKILHPIRDCLLRTIHTVRNLLLGMAGQPQIKSCFLLALLFLFQRPGQPLGEPQNQGNL